MLLLDVLFELYRFYKRYLFIECKVYDNNHETNGLKYVGANRASNPNLLECSEFLSPKRKRFIIKMGFP